MNTTPLSPQNDISYPFLPLSPKRLISLWDMIQFLARDLAHDWQWLLGEKNNAYKKASNPDTFNPAPEDINRITALLKGDDRLICKGLMHFCDSLGMDKSKSRINLLLMKLSSSNTTPNCHVIHSELLAIEHGLWEELKARKFVFVPLDKYFEQDGLFGDAVNATFKEFVSEIKEAGNCLAMELNTAGVCLLMRVVERGLRMLAAELKVTIRHDLEFADWEEIITGIKNSIGLLEKAFRDAKREQDLIFYHAMLDDVKRFKVLRHEVMHARRPYSQDEAKEICSRVGSFLKKLAEKK